MTYSKITVYMPPEMIAELDEMRSKFRRQGKAVDRGRLVRDCIRAALPDLAPQRDDGADGDR